MILAVANQKGGVGKTTTVVNLAALWARRCRVLVVDLDPQGNATSASGVDKRALALEQSSYGLLVLGCRADEVLQRASSAGYDVIGANRELAGAEVELLALERRERRLAEALAPLRESYEVILLDCPPSLSLLTLNALCAADGLLVPMSCEYYALEGLSDLMATVEQVRSGFNAKLQLVGIVRVMFDARVMLQQQVSEELKQFFGDQLLETVVPRNVRLAEAPSHGVAGVVYDSRSRGARAYEQVAAELCRRLGLSERCG